MGAVKSPALKTVGIAAAGFLAAKLVTKYPLGQDFSAKPYSLCMHTE